jgi:C-terminal processing protease CtpA/Prc
MRRLSAVAAAALVSVTAPSLRAQPTQEVERLAALGQVWGFLKYFHAGVATGTVHWDSALVDAVPRVRASRTSEEFNAAIQRLLDAAGPMQPCADSSTENGTRPCGAIGPDSLRRNVDFTWLDASTILSPAVVQRLQAVRANPHRGASRYVRFFLTAMFPADTAFETPEYPVEGVRLLALFRFWNAARYYFPYMYVNDGDWNDVLPEFIPRLLASMNADQYHATILELTTRLNDAHVNASSGPILRMLGGRYPAFETRSVGGQIVVWKLARGESPSDDGLRVGDVITSVNGEPVAQLRQGRARYVAAGNPAVFERKLVQNVLRTNDDSVTYAIERGGRLLTRRVSVPPRPAATGPRVLPDFPVADLAFVLPNTNVGYINMGDLNQNQVDSALAIVRNTSGIVMDVRNYPRGTMYRFAQFFNPEARPFVRFTRVDSTFPGQFNWERAPIAGSASGNPDHYRGRVAILVDETTQSHAEFTVMALRTAPENWVIGSQTAGADGNVTLFSLPGGIRTLFTGLGVYFPDGQPTQRIGIVPDIEVRPTLTGIRARRDEVLERALVYIRTGR